MLYKHQEGRRGPLEIQVVKQQTALETGRPFAEACAELICEAAHLGAAVVELPHAGRGEPRDLAYRATEAARRKLGKEGVCGGQ